MPLAISDKGKLYWSARRHKWTAEAIIERFQHYLEWCDAYEAEYASARGVVVRYNKKRVPTLRGFANYAGVQHEEFMTWKDRKKMAAKVQDVLDKYEQSNKNEASTETRDTIIAKYEELHEVAKYVVEYVLNAKVDALINGEGSAQGIVFDLKANHGMNDKLIVDNIGDKKVEVKVIRSADEVKGLGEGDNS